MLEKAAQLGASLRAKVEHPFRTVKQQFGHAKVRCRGLAKNTARLTMLFALGSLWAARQQVLGARGCPSKLVLDCEIAGTMFVLPIDLDRLSGRQGMYQPVPMTGRTRA